MGYCHMEPLVETLIKAQPLSFKKMNLKISSAISRWFGSGPHDDIFRVTGPLCGNSPVTGEFPHKGQWRGALIFPLICAWTNGWVNNRDASDLIRHRAHYDFTVMQHVNIAKYSNFRNSLHNAFLIFISKFVASLHFVCWWNNKWSPGIAKLHLTEKSGTQYLRKICIHVIAILLIE